MNRVDPLNTRILVIDDEESVRDSFLAVLCPGASAGAAVDAAAEALFGEPEPPLPSNVMRFAVDCAANGKQALARVEAAVAADLPYAMIFCDMRMPGWDGKQTVEHIRKIDPRAEIVFVTAYSDHTLASLVEAVGADIGYHVKPFATDELKQLVTKGVLDWNRARELEALMRTVTSIRGDASDIDRLLGHLLQQICAWLDTDSAALGRIGEGIQFRAGVGRLADPAAALPLLERAVHEGPHVEDGTLVLPIWEFGVAIALLRGPRIPPDRLYLLRVFLEHAAVAIKNSEMTAKLVEAQRMSAVGQAVGFIAHDLRGQVGMVRMLLEMVRDDDESAMPRDEMLATAGRLLGQALALVGETLAFCRGEVRVAPQRVDLDAVLADTLRVARHRLGSRSVALVPEIPAGLVASVDALGIARVLQNLINNAGDALDGRAGARVTVTAAGVPGGVAIRVADNGPGLPAELLDRLFEPFATAGKPGGTGFGLAIVQQIVAAHGGRVSVDTGPEGTCFTVFLPGGGDPG